MYADTLRFEPGDVRLTLVEAAALKLAGALDESNGTESPGIARELRVYLGWLAEFGTEVERLDEIRAARAHRRVEQMLKGHKGYGS